MSVLDLFSLKDRVVVITGASSGIGRAIAIACAEAGATVAAIGRNEARLNALLMNLREITPYAHFIRSFDVTQFSGIPELVGEIVTQCGKISGFVHAAGIAQTCPLRVMTQEIYKQIYDINVIAGFEFARALSSKRVMASSASFVFLSSVAALKGESALLAYSSSKGAVLAGARSLAAELGSRNIRVNTLIPGQILDTIMGTATKEGLTEEDLERLRQKHLLGFGKVDAITGGALYFLSDASWWTTGAALNIDGGYTL